MGALAILAGYGWSRFTLRQIEVSGYRSLTRDQATALVASQTRQHFTWRNLLTLDNSGLEKALLAASYQIKSAEVKRRWPQGIAVTLVERQPSLTWQTGNQTYLLDADGSIIGLAEGGNSKLPSVVDTSNLPVKAGDRVVSAGFVQFCQDLVNLLPKRTDLQITGLRVPQTTTELEVLTNKGYFLKLDTGRGAAGQMEDLVTVLAELAKLKRAPSEYIDLRIERKAYYR